MSARLPPVPREQRSGKLPGKAAAPDAKAQSKPSRPPVSPDARTGQMGALEQNTHNQRYKQDQEFEANQ